MEASNNLIKINNHLPLNLEKALQDETYLLSYAGVLPELQQEAKNSKNVLSILIVSRLLLEKAKKSPAEEVNIWLKNIIENIRSEEIIYFLINLKVDFYKNYKSSILQLINILEALPDESKLAWPNIQKITFELYILLNCFSSNRKYESKLKILYNKLINNSETTDSFKQHATNLLIEASWKRESNFPFAGPRSKKTQAIDNLFKSPARDVQFFEKLYKQTVKWQKEENYSFWRLSARTEAVQNLEYRTAYQLFMSYPENTEKSLKHTIDNLLNVINAPIWEIQGTFGLPTGIKKLRTLAKHHKKIGDFEFLWQARNIIEERVNINICEHPLRIFTQMKRSINTNIFYVNFLAYCDFTNKDILTNLVYLSSLYTHDSAIERFTGKIEFDF